MVRVGVLCRELPDDGADLGRIAELGEELLAIGPGEAEVACLGDADSEMGVRVQFRENRSRH